jgi:acyl-CoA synthetase (AMP-forming)/AMP-acid ligase II
MLIGDIARRNARRHPNKLAVIYGDRRTTWGELDERANRLATFLQSRGLVMGDRVAVIARNIGHWPEITYGLAKAGLVLVPINARVSASEASFMIGDADARAAIVFEEQVELFGPVVEHLDVVIGIDTTALPVEYETALGAGRNVHSTPAELTPDHLHFLLYTSGTTGRPKGVMNVHRAMIMQAFDTNMVTEAVPEDIMLASTPFYTAGGMLRTVSWMFLGQTMVIHPRFDSDRVIHDIEHLKVSMTTFIPTMLQRLLKQAEDEPGHDFSSLRRISYGSAPSADWLAKKAIDLLGCELQQRYGLTEAGGQVTILTPGDHRRMLSDKPELVASCGRETPQSEIRICDENGVELPRGEIGELVIQAESMAKGYWNQPDATSEAFRPDGLRSGDVGKMDDEGYVYIVSRKTDMIISGGFNVYPAEIERVIGGHPGVELVAVVGKNDPEWGETPVAVIVTPRS